jgi:pimeloyl-ACP methyl ester carboxylesterase
VTASFDLQRLRLHGHQLSYRTSGSGPVIVLVHGMAGSSDTWRLVAPALAKHFTVVAPDLLGHGTSAKPRADYSLGAFASGIRDLLVALGHEQATIVGQSLGGGVAMQFAYQFPERCERLVLVASGGLGEEVNPLLRALTLPGAELILPVACASWFRDAGDAVLGFFRRIGLRPGAHLDEIWRSYGSLADTATRTAFLQTLRAVVDQSGQRVSAADKLYLAAAVPTLIMWGDHDNIIPVRQAHATHAAIPGSRLEIFAGAGHFPHCERPEEFARILIDFMQSTAPAAMTATEWRELLQAPLIQH